MAHVLVQINAAVWVHIRAATVQFQSVMELMQLPTWYVVLKVNATLQILVFATVVSQEAIVPFLFVMVSVQITILYVLHMENVQDTTNAFVVMTTLEAIVTIQFALEFHQMIPQLAQVTVRALHPTIAVANLHILKQTVQYICVCQMTMV